MPKRRILSLRSCKRAAGGELRNNTPLPSHLHRLLSLRLQRALTLPTLPSGTGHRRPAYSGEQTGTTTASPGTRGVVRAKELTVACACASASAFACACACACACANQRLRPMRWPSLSARCCMCKICDLNSFIDGIWKPLPPAVTTCRFSAVFPFATSSSGRTRFTPGFLSDGFTGTGRLAVELTVLPFAIFDTSLEATSDKKARDARDEAGMERTDGAPDGVTGANA